MTNMTPSPELALEEAKRLVGNWLAEDVDFYDNLPANYETRKAIRAVFAALTLFEVRR